MTKFEEEFTKIRYICMSSEFVQKIDQTIEHLGTHPIVLYGAGTLGVSVANILKFYKLEVIGFCDKNKSGIQKDTCLPIASPDILINGDTNIIICSINYADEIEQDLYLLGVSAERIFAYESLFLPEFTLEGIQPLLCGYEESYNLFADQTSKCVLMDRLSYYLTASPLAYSAPELQYFDPEVMPLSYDEVFVDGGMYIGDTAEAFFKAVFDKYKHYYGFEPDQKNYFSATKNLEGKQNVTIVPNGLWSSEANLCFSADMASSCKLDVAGNDFTNVTALDGYFTDKNPPTMIKMDIEGAEMEALKGAENIIRKFKPKLAICAYHKPEDIFVLPKLIQNFRPDYKFYLRHYSDSIYETVLYAI